MKLFFEGTEFSYIKDSSSKPLSRLTSIGS